MVPPNLGESTSQTKKQRTRKTSILVQGGASSTEASYLVNFPREYVAPTKPIAKLVNLPKEPKYDLIAPEIPLEVNIEGDMLGTIGNLKFSYHDLENMKKFLELAPQNYLCMKLSPYSLLLRVKLQ